ncbi:MAG: ATP-dependent RNA helicase DbpA [Candidatus Dactylopiibacterium sp.]|nr:ATP-dependent RNA helicase DbpA [Candidatus Dactylopiibacterium sp.]
MSDFARLGLAPAQLAVLEQLEYHRMTPIQAAALPPALAGRDLIAQARTGSGKTAAFALPLLARLKPRHFVVQALVLCPTRELAEQVAQEIRRLARAQENIKVLALCGGSPIRAQTDSLAHGAHVVVGTPGRLMDHLQRGSLQLDALTTLVLDEADRMLDMGFHDDIAWIAEHCPAWRQTLLFSATYPEGIAALAARFLREPEQVRLADTHAPGQIRQRFYLVEPGTQLDAAAHLLRHVRPTRALAFCNTRAQCRALAERLQAAGFEALTLHGELEQRERDEVLIRFSNGSANVLVATDVAARGLDIAELDCVLNAELSPDAEVHTHRVGRTGRADAEGVALSLVTPAQRRRVDDIARTAAIEPEWHDLAALDADAPAPLPPAMATLLILAGKRDKLRPGDVLGALTADAGFTREQIGRINVTDAVTYVAVAREIAGEALRRLGRGRIKGRSLRVRRI